MILSVVLNSDDSVQKEQKNKDYQEKNRSYPDRFMNCTTSGVNFDPDGPYQMVVTYFQYYQDET